MKNFIILLILAFSYNCMAGNNEPAHVIITAGQSNTDGRVPNDRLPGLYQSYGNGHGFHDRRLQVLQNCAEPYRRKVPSFLA